MSLNLKFETDWKTLEFWNFLMALWVPPLTTPFDLAVTQSWFHGKCHPESPGIFAPTFLVALLTGPPLFHAMLVLVVSHQWTLCQFLPAFQAEHQLLLSLIETPSLPRHPPCAEHVCLYPLFSIWLAYHPHGLVDIFIQPYPVENIY